MVKYELNRFNSIYIFSKGKKKPNLYFCKEYLIDSNIIVFYNYFVTKNYFLIVKIKTHNNNKDNLLNYHRKFHSQRKICDMNNGLEY